MPRTVNGGLGVRYELGKELGRGSFGVVYEATDAAGLKWACKVIEKAALKTEKSKEQLTREIATMKAIQHEHVVQLREVLETGSRYYIFLELVCGGTLLNKVDSEHGGIHFINEADVRRYFRQLASGLRFCHANKVAHRDIKLENVLLKDDSCKIADFGMANFQGGTNKAVLSTKVGTQAYCAPEIMTEAQYDGFSADAFSTGVVLCALLTGRFPPRDVNQQVRMEGQSMFKHLSAEAMSLLSMLFEPNAAVRLRNFQGGEHPWLKDLDDTTGKMGDMGANPFDDAKEDSHEKDSCHFALQAPLAEPKLGTVVAKLSAAAINIVDKDKLTGLPAETPIRAMKKSAAFGKIVSLLMTMTPGNERDSFHIEHERGGSGLDFVEAVADIARALHA